MTSQIIPVDPFDFIIFGGTGDLAERKLIPALYQRQRAGQFSDPTRIIGASRSAMSDDEYRDFARKAIAEHVHEGEIDAAEIESFVARMSYVRADARSGEGFDALKAALGDSHSIRVYYFAVGPSLFGDIARNLAAHGLADDAARIVVEKPIGRSLNSARELNDAIGGVFDEHQIFRIDHYLGKETVQNLMALRFANALYEPLWNSAHIDHVQITVAESVGLEGRAGYYDKAGALRDMVQNHMLQLLCLVAMEAPASMDADAVRDEKLKVIRALNPVDYHHIVRGQYAASDHDPSYRDDVDNARSTTESFIALKVMISNWRWAGTPFYLRTGKKLRARTSEIAVVFKDTPHSIFGEEAGRHRNVLSIQLQPNEGITLGVTIKEPGPGGMRLVDVPLDMTFADALGPDAEEVPDAYERLIMDVIRGNQTLFMRGDEVLAAWAWTDPLIQGWTSRREVPKPYDAGSSGPEDALMLMHRDGRRWRDIRA